MYSRIKRFFKLGIDPVPYSLGGSERIWCEEDWRHDLFTTQFNPSDSASELHLLSTIPFELCTLHIGRYYKIHLKITILFLSLFLLKKKLTLIQENCCRNFSASPDAVRYNKSESPDELRQMVPMIKVITETDISYS